MLSMSAISRRPNPTDHAVSTAALDTQEGGCPREHAGIDSCTIACFTGESSEGGRACAPDCRYCVPGAA